MRIVDSQVHIWGAPSPSRPWRSGPVSAHRDRPVAAAETLEMMDREGVHIAVLVPPSWEGDRNELAVQAAADHPDRFVVMGRVSYNEPDLRVWLDNWCKQPGARGLRLTLHTEPERSAFLAGQMNELWAAAEARSLPVMIYPPGLCREVRSVAERHEGLRIVVDHLAVPTDLAGPAAFDVIPELLDLARCPNVAVKASAVPCMSREPSPFKDLHNPLRMVIDAFGPSRTFWGSDWTRLPCSYAENLRLFTHHLDFLEPHEVGQVMGEGLLDWLDLEDSGDFKNISRSNRSQSL